MSFFTNNNSALSLRKPKMTWSSQFLSASGAEVSTNGTLVQALNFGRGVSSDFDTIINGVLFSGFGNGNAGTGTFSNPTLSPFSANSGSVTNVFYTNGPLNNFSLLLSNGIFSTNSAGNTVTLSNLLVGRTYQVQLFFADNRTTAVSLRGPVIDYGIPNKQFGNIKCGDNNATGFVYTGSFITDTTSKIFTINMVTPGNPNTVSGLQLNAYQLRLL